MAERFYFKVWVNTDTLEHARTVMCERIGPDEDYGFDYTIDWVPDTGHLPAFDDVKFYSNEKLERELAFAFGFADGTPPNSLEKQWYEHLMEELKRRAFNATQ